MGKTILSVILLATSAGLFFFWTKPYYTQIKDLESQKESMGQVIDNAQKIQKSRDAIMEEYNNIPEENLAKLNKIVPNYPDSIRFIIELQNIVSESGMLLKGIDANISLEEKEFDDKQEELYKVMNFSLKVSGSYNSFYSLLRKLETNLHLMDVKSVSFSSSEKDFYEFDVSGVSYWKK